MLLALSLTFLSFLAVSAFVLLRESWNGIESDDPRKELAAEVLPVLRRSLRSIPSFRRRAL